MSRPKWQAENDLKEMYNAMHTLEMQAKHITTQKHPFPQSCSILSVHWLLSDTINAPHLCNHLLFCVLMYSTAQAQKSHNWWSCSVFKAYMCWNMFAMWLICRYSMSQNEINIFMNVINQCPSTHTHTEPDY